MTRIIKHNDKRQSMQDSISKIIQQKQVKTQSQIEIKQRNINKLIFLDSEDQQQQKQKKNLQLYQTEKKLRVKHQLTLQRPRPFSRQSRGQSNRLKPSLMRGQTDGEDQYQQIINCQTFRPSIKAPFSNPIPKRTMLSQKTQQNNLFQQLVNRRDKKRLSKMAVSSLPISQTSYVIPKQPQIQKKTKDKQQITIPKLQVATLFFQQSDEQPENKQNKQTDLEPSINLFQKISIQQQAVQSSQTKNKKQKQSQPQLPAKESNNQPIPQVDIANCSLNLQIQKNSMYLQDYLKQLQSNELQRVPLMMTPIRPGTRQIFHLEVSNTISEKYYALWLDMGQQRRLLMKASKTIKFNKTIFEFLTFDGRSRHFLDTCFLQSNIDRSLFNIYKQQRKINKRRILATYSQSVNINNHKSIVMYIPKLDVYNQPAIIYDNNSDENLYTVFREGKLAVVDYVMTTRLEINKKMKLMGYHCLKASQKSMEFKNSQNQMQVIIGKKASKQYKIIAGPSISPIQLFGLAIVQIET